MRQIHLLQLDSVPVIIRTQYMPMFSRLGVYDPSLIDDIAYGRDEWFEAFVHEASVVPVEDEPLYRFFKTRSASGQTWRNLYALAQTEAPYVAEVLNEVAERGPLRASELSAPRPRDGEWWSSRSVGSIALDWLFRIGAVGVRRTGNFEKQFDLLDRIVPSHVRQVPTPSEHDSLSELIVRSAQAHGIGTAAGLVDYFRLPKRASAPLFAELVEDGRLVACVVSDPSGNAMKAFMHPDATVPRSVEARALLSPFDPIVWNRPRASWLFDFEYRIEIYVPKSQRQYGYYVMPFLLGDRLVARCDLKTDRQAGLLRLLGVWPEPDVGAEIVDDLADELRMLARLVGVDDVCVESTDQLSKSVSAALKVNL